MTTNGSDRDPPNLDKIIKLMGMTGSSHDPEAISALRMATKLMKDWGWTWDSVLRGKIKIMPDPFANLPTPTTGDSGTGYMRAPPAPPPPPKQFDNRDEMEKYFDKVNMPGKKIPVDIAARLNSIERTWNANGFLLWKDYDFLRTQANKRRF
jgi:hypothetical protein